MKLIEARAAYDRFAGKASDVARQLGLAGLALVWLLSLRTETGSGLPAELVLPAGLLVAGLALDLLQYLYATMAWGVLHRSKEIAGTREDQEFRVSAKVNWPTNTLFWSKQAVIVIAYLLLLQELFS